MTGTPEKTPEPGPQHGPDLVLAAADRLGAHLTGGRAALFAEVIAAWDIEAARRVRMPVAVTGLLEERTEEFYRRSGDEPWRIGPQGAVQRVEATLGVLIVIPVKNDPGGAAAKKAARLEPLRDALRQVLLGWVPPIAGDPDPLMLMQGRIVGLRDGRLWWQEDYVTAYWVSGGAGLCHNASGGASRGVDLRVSQAPRIGAQHEEDYEQVGGTTGEGNADVWGSVWGNVWRAGRGGSSP